MADDGKRGNGNEERKVCGCIITKGKRKHQPCGLPVIPGGDVCRTHLQRGQERPSPATKDLVRDRILGFPTSVDNKVVMLRHYNNLKSVDGGSSEGYKNQVFLDWCFRYPWGKYVSLNERQTPSDFLKTIRQEFDKSIYGMDHVKNEILNFVAKLLTNPESDRNNLALFGPPGVAKTKFVKVLSRVLGVPMKTIALGGIRDTSFFTGHGYVYVESSPGKIIQTLIETNCSNPLIYFDELDKVSASDHGKDIYSFMTYLLDPTQNAEYADHYFYGMKFDLSRVFYVFTFNDINAIDKVLLDRLNVVYVTEPTREEKAVILKDYCFAEILKNVGLQYATELDSESVEFVLAKNGNFGVRTLYRIIEKVVMEMNKEHLLHGKEIPTITRAVMAEYYSRVVDQLVLRDDGTTPKDVMDSMYM